jgi:phage terminase Nu1 subunit (DNA packaging protein)
MGRHLDDGGDPRIGEARAKARLAREQADARRARAKADLAEGRSIELVEAQRQINELAAAVRSALDRAPSYLPETLPTDVRSAAAAAMAQAIERALATINGNREMT